MNLSECKNRLIRHEKISIPPVGSVNLMVCLWRPWNFTPIHSLIGPVGQPFASRPGGQRFASQACLNSQWNRVSPVNAVSLHWWPWRDPIGPLTLATGCVRPIPITGGGGGALWSSCISHTFTMSHWFSGLTVSSPPQGAAVCTLGVQPTLWNWDYLLALSCYIPTCRYKCWLYICLWHYGRT